MLLPPESAAVQLLARYAEDQRVEVQNTIMRSWKFFEPKVYAEAQKLYCARPAQRLV